MSLYREQSYNIICSNTRTGKILDGSSVKKQHHHGQYKNKLRINRMTFVLSQKVVVPGINPNLLLILVGLVVDDVEEAKLVDTLGGGDDAEPVTELLLLKELLGPVVVPHWLAFMPSTLILVVVYLQVLEVATRELLVGDDLNLAVTLLGDLDGVAEVAGAAINLDAVVKELLEGGDIEDLVAHGLRGVDDELRGASVPERRRCEEDVAHTFLVTLEPFLGPARFCCNSHLAYCSLRPSLTQEFGGQQSSEHTTGAIFDEVVGDNAKCAKKWVSCATAVVVRVAGVKKKLRCASWCRDFATVPVLG